MRTDVTTLSMPLVDDIKNTLLLVETGNMTIIDASQILVDHVARAEKLKNEFFKSAIASFYGDCLDYARAHHQLIEKEYYITTDQLERFFVEHNLL